MAAHRCCLPVKLSVLSGAGQGAPRGGAHALEGPQSHAAMPRKHRLWLWSPSRTSILAQTPHHSPPTLAVVLPPRTKAASEGLGSRKRAGGTDSLQKQSCVRKEVTIPRPKEYQCLCPGEPSRQEVSLLGSPWERCSQLLACSHALHCCFPSS